MSARKITCVALLAASSIALAACESGPETPPTPTPTQSQEKQSGTLDASRPPDQTKYAPASANGPAKNVPIPRMPELANKNSKNGAKSFTEYYFDLVNYTIETNDTKPIKQFTTHACEVCGLSIIDPSDRAKIDGRWQVGGKHRYKVISSEKTGANLAITAVRYTADSAKYYMEPNIVETELEPLASTIVSVGLEYDSGWKVYKIAGDE